MTQASFSDHWKKENLRANLTTHEFFDSQSVEALMRRSVKAEEEYTRFTNIPTDNSRSLEPETWNYEL